MNLQATVPERWRKSEKLETTQFQRVPSQHERKIMDESSDRYSEFMDSVNRTSDREIERALKQA